jgi:hypothetical protein
VCRRCCPPTPTSVRARRSVGAPLRPEGRPSPGASGTQIPRRGWWSLCHAIERFDCSRETQPCPPHRRSPPASISPSSAHRRCAETSPSRSLIGRPESPLTVALLRLSEQRAGSAGPDVRSTSPGLNRLKMPDFRLFHWSLPGRLPEERIPGDSAWIARATRHPRRVAERQQHAQIGRE